METSLLPLVNRKIRKDRIDVGVTFKFPVSAKVRKKRDVVCCFGFVRSNCESAKLNFS